MRALPLLLGLAACDVAPPATVAPHDTDDSEHPDDTDDTTRPDTDCADADADGAACDDCDDTDPARFPGATERCNGLDDDCDGGTIDEDPEGDAWSCTPCDAGGYWAAVRDATTDADLTARVRAVTDAFDACFYDTARARLFLALDNHDGLVRCVYTGDVQDLGQELPDWDVMNVEHTWPGADGGRDGIRECDLHHLFPTMADANNRRADHPFGVVTGAVDWTRGGSRLGDDAQGDTVFEPRSDHKGDVARAMLYMSLRHQLPLPAGQAALFRQWHAADPPAAADLARTLAIRDEQGNANPFVACPQIAGRVQLP